MQENLVLDNLRFDRLSVEDGLSQNSGFSILQDSNGFMWFATQDGLNKYDGRNFTVYKHDPDNTDSLSDNWIWVLHEDRLGMLWIGTLNGGLNRYDPKLNQFTHYQHDPDNSQSLSNNEVLSIYEDTDGILWIGTRGGLDRFDSETETFTYYYHNPDDPQSLKADAILSIIQTRDGILWIGTESGGLSRFDRETETFTHFSNDPDSPGHNNIWAIYEDSSEMLWIGSDAGLDQFNRETGEFTRFQNDPDDPHSLSHNAIRAIYEDPSGYLWIGTDGGGLNRLDPETEIFTHYQNDPGDPRSLSYYSVSEIYQDREGVLWIGTNGGGINKLFLGGLKFAYFKHIPNDPNSLSSIDVRGIHEDKSGALWVATDGGLNRLDQETGQWQHYLHAPDDPFSISSNVLGDVYEDQDGLLWIGTYDGKELNSFDPETGQFTRYQDDPDDPSSFTGSLVFDIYQDRQGILWIGTIDAGINRFDPATGRFTHYRTNPDDPDSISSDAIIAIYEDQQGLLWFGTFDNGLNKFDRDSETFTHFQADPEEDGNLSSNFIIAIYEDTRGTLWVGTGGGLNKFDPQTETFTHYREKDGLPNDLIYAILEDGQGYLWMSTNKGISRFDPQTETFRNFDIRDGLQSNEFSGLSYYKSTSGEMFFGGINGFNAFYPDSVLANNPYLPPVALTLFTQGGEELDLGQSFSDLTEVTLDWPNNFFEFEFAALSYAHPEENQYAYMLEGFDDHWNHTERGYGRYTNLPGGTYTLRLIGSNNDGIWNEEGASIMIRVMPPFWETWGFRGIGLLILLGTIMGGYRLRVRSIEQHSHELEKQVRARTMELSRANVLLGREIAEHQEAEAELTQRAADDAVVEERRRMARELHDSVTQSLHGSTLLAEAGQRLAKAGDLERATGYFIRLGEISQQALKEMRLLIYELRPLALREVGLAAALRHRLDYVEKRTSTETKLSVEVGIDIPEMVEDALFRIAQEALNNALKYAKPSSVVVGLRLEGDPLDQQVVLEIIDDGIGFDIETAEEQGGIGLLSMRERAENLGGEIVIRPIPGEGTSVKVTIGLKEQKHD